MKTLYENIDEIKTAWVKNDYKDLIYLLDLCVAGGSTYHEILGRTGTLLNALKIISGEKGGPYNVVKTNINEILKMWHN